MPIDVSVIVDEYSVVNLKLCELNTTISHVISMQFDLFTAIHKHYSLEEWQHFADRNPSVLGVI